ncbi:NAD-dependent epimerase/dehydratase family protein [Vibrio splendidus]|uniref:NAD-dependent epimerase/dehydratase family protein n=1 Tax=Vibrio splendidus TaxID=29497 RepID=UPI000D36F8B4|nr:NAD-dependent epimerase/dehydratase family protein [Vibrio splendidus]PTO85993.1 hypothetical protein CWO29_19555 [Vibrio splendidus]
MGKILLTGSNGFIGCHFPKDNKDIIAAIHTNHTYQFANEIHVGEISRYTDWSSALNNVDCIVHLAEFSHSKFDNESYLTVNRQGTKKLIDDAFQAGVSRFIYISSALVLPYLSAPKTRSIPLNIKIKIENENYLKSMARKHQKDFVIIRPCLVYGSYPPGNMGRLFKFVSKTMILPFRSINNRRDFLSVYNLVDFISTCMYNKNSNGEEYFVSDGNPMSIKDFCLLISKLHGRRVFQLSIPASFFYFFGTVFRKSSLVEQLIGDFVVDIKNQESQLDWKPRFTIEESFSRIKETYND